MDNFSQKSNIISSLFNVTQPPQPGTIRTILLPHPCSVRALPTEFRSGCWSMRCRSELNPNRKRSEAKIEAKKRVRRKRPGTLIAATSAQMEDVSSPKQGMAMANHWSLHYFRFISRWPLLSWKVTPCATDFHECFIDLNLCYFTNSSTSKFVDFSCHFGWVFRLPQRSHLGPPHQLHEPLLPTLNSHFRCFLQMRGC